jgi:DHA2 family multidrug resistance protein-like MFS transporter
VPVFIALLAVSGAGFGLFQTPNNYVIVSSAPPNKSGSVGALRAATRIAGQLMGSAFCGLAFLLADTTHAFDGPRLGVAMAAAMALLACILSASRGKTPARTQTS